ncbi:hypothetical protein ACYSNW_10825 [Enterococcus sp. LJL99]
MDLLVMLFFVYFIREQFEYNEVTRWNYVLIPIFTIGSLIMKFEWTVQSIVELLIIMGIGGIISYFQAKYTQVRLETKEISYFKDTEGIEHPIYKKMVTAKGGIVYLCGWTLILVVQFLIELLVEHVAIDKNLIFSEIIKEAAREVLSSLRIGDENTGWSIWALIASTSGGYTYFLAKKSSDFHKAVFKK